MAGEQFLARLNKEFGERITGANLEAIDPWIEVAPHALVEVSTYLRDQPDLRFEMLNCITAVDYLEPDPKKAAKAKFEPHMELVYHVSSITNKHTLVVKVQPIWQP